MRHFPLLAAFLAPALAFALKLPGVEEEPGPLHYEPNPRSTYEPKVFSGGPKPLVMWRDERGDGSGWHSGANLMIARVGADGQVQDPGGLAWQEPGPGRWDPDQVFDGSRHFVAWGDGNETNDVYAAYADVDGRLVSPIGKIAATAKNERGAAVAFDGERHVVAWVESDDNTVDTRLLAQVVDAQAQGIGTPVVIATSQSILRSVRAVASGNDLLFLWTEFDGQGARIRLSRWPRTGAPSAPVTVTPADKRCVDLALAPISGGFVAAWQQSDTANGPLSLVVQKLDASAALQGTPVVVATEAGGTYASLVPSIAAHLPVVHVTWLSGSSPSAVAKHDTRRITDLSEVGNGQFLGSNQGAASLGCSGDTCLAGWSVSAGSLLNRAQISRLDGAGTATDAGGITLSTIAEAQSEAVVASDGTHFLVGWTSVQADGIAHVYARMRKGDGSWLDAAPVELGTGGRFSRLTLYPRPGGGFLVLWSRPKPSRDYENDVVGSWIAAGEHVSASPVFTAAGGYSDWTLGSGACGTTGCLFTLTSFSDTERTYLLRLAPDATPPQPTVSPVPYSSIAWAAGRYVLVNADPAGFVTANDAGVLDGQPARALLPASAHYYSQGAAAFSDGTRVVLAWHFGVEDANSVINDELDLQQIGASGEVSALKLLRTVEKGFTSVAAMAPLPDGWAVVLRENQGEEKYGLVGFETGLDLAVRGEAVQLVKRDWWLSVVSLATLPNAAPLLGYGRIDTAPDRGFWRAKLTMLDGSTGGPAKLDLGALCESDDACGSGHCADGVCCDSACGGGALDDCQACAVAAGASVDGHCGPVIQGGVCRSANGTCDKPERCDGSSLSCPPAQVDACVDDAGPGPQTAKEGCGCGGMDVGALAVLALFLRRRR